MVVGQCAQTTATATAVVDKIHPTRDFINHVQGHSWQQLALLGGKDPTQRHLNRRC
jgi:hypothetical protein